MCHLILALPFIALPMFWLLPLSIAAPLYCVVLALAIGAYVMTVRAMRQPVTTGAEALMNAVGTVSAVDQRAAHVWVQSEQWAASCADAVLAVGDSVAVIGLEGLMLQVRRLASPARSAQAQPSRPASTGLQESPN